MPFRQLADLSYDQVRGLDRARTVAILPVGAIEAHGPHLPLATDVLIAGAMAQAGAERLRDRGFDSILLPPLPYTAAPFAAAFAGTISVAPAIVTGLIMEVARAASRLGFKALALANAHLDPSHLRALAEAVSSADREGLAPVVAPDLTRKPWATRLTEEFKSGACHAGRFETSIVLAVRPDLVREDARRGLAPNPASLSSAIAEGKQTFEEAGGPSAYFGWPSDATAEEGRASIDELGRILADAVRQRLLGSVSP